MNIKLVDLKAEYQSIKYEIDEAIQRVIDNSSFILGKEVEQFEENFAKYIGVKYCIGVSSCTAALHLALEYYGVGIDDSEVMVPVRTVAADAEAVKMVCSNISFYDGEPAIVNQDAVIIVHLYGMPHEIPVIKNEYTDIIEDCAQATGAEINGKKCGTFGEISCFSFFPSKVLGCMGDGGAICTNNEVCANEIRAVRNHGRLEGKKYIHQMVGNNYRLDGIQAAILNAKLPHLDEWIIKRRLVAQWYNKRLKGIVDIPIEPEGYKSVYYVYAIECNNRAKLREYLIENGIQTGVHYPVPLHRQPAYNTCGSFPEAEKWADRTLSLPMHPFIKEDEVEYVSNKIKEFYESSTHS